MNDPTATVGAWYALLSQQAPGAERRPPLPTPPTFDPQGANEPPADYGLRALLYVLAHEHAIGLPDRALELAQYAAPLATAHADISPRAAETIAGAVSRIGAMLRARAALDAEYGQDTPQDAPGAPAGRDKPHQGPGAPLSPQPVPRPPQGSQAQPPAALVDQDDDPNDCPVCTDYGRGRICPTCEAKLQQPRQLSATRPAPVPVLTRADFDF